MLRKLLEKCAALALAGTLVAATVPMLPHAQTARADDDMDALNAQVTQSAAAYNAAVAKQEELADEISTLNTKIEKLQKELPKQQERSDDSYRALYKYQYDTSSVVSMLLSSESITDMLAALDQYNWVIDYNVNEISKTVKMEKELKESKAKLESDKSEADAAASEAYSTLQQARQARKEAQERAIAEQKAEEEAAKKEAAQAAKEKAQSEGKSSSSTKKAVAKAEAKVTTESSNASASSVDLSSPRAKFISKWAARINSYLAGSPQAGTGKYYAAAAWDNGVDPRWAPAISYIESGLGNQCFASYNAWGYGSSGFSSWEEGINTVVAALGGSLYGGKLTRAAAQTYCPPNWQNWYSTVSAQMAQI